MLRSEDPELYLEKAVHRLCDYYGKALTLEYVRNKIAWALYQTWKEFDKKSEERRMSENMQPTCNKVATDLISRQAAIKAICEDGTWLESQGCTEITMAERKQRDADILGELPSAQPDSGYIEQMKWERDLAIRQLADLGYGLGEKPRTNGDLISRQAAIDALNTVYNEWQTQESCSALEEATSMIEGLPSAERKGKWINNSPVTMKCDQCGYVIRDWRWNESNFCANCGAKMERREE